MDAIGRRSAPPLDLTGLPGTEKLNDKEKEVQYHIKYILKTDELGYIDDVTTVCALLLKANSKYPMHVTSFFPRLRVITFSASSLSP